MNYIKFMLTALVLLLSSYAHAYEDWSWTCPSDYQSSSHEWNIPVTKGQYIVLDYSHVTAENKYGYFSISVDGGTLVSSGYGDIEDITNSAVYKCETTGTVRLRVYCYSIANHTFSLSNIRVLDTAPAITELTLKDLFVGVNSNSWRSVECNSTPQYLPGQMGATWSSSNTAVATVNQNGAVTGVSAGTATITATVGSVSASCVVTVKQTESITLNNMFIGLHNDYNYINYSVQPSFASRSLDWSSSDESVATVYSDGMVSPHSVGTCTITATAKDGSGVSGSCTCTVLDGYSRQVSGTDGAVSSHEDAWNLGYVNSYGGSYYNIENDNGTYFYGGYISQTEGSSLTCIFTFKELANVRLSGYAGGTYIPNFSIDLDGKNIYQSRVDGDNYVCNSFSDGTLIYHYELNKMLRPGTYTFQLRYNNGNGNSEKDFVMLENFYFETYRDTTWNACIANHSVVMDTIRLERAGTLGAEALKLHANFTDFKGLYVSGPMDEYDWSTIKEMGLTCLDVTDALPNKYPASIDNITAVRMSKYVTSIDHNPFPYAYYMYIPDEVNAITATGFKRQNWGETPFFLDGCHGIMSMVPKAFNHSNICGSFSFDNLEEVPNNAFSNCQYLSAVELPKAKKVGHYAFFNTPIETIELAEVDSIMDHAFCMAPITRATLPKAKYIGKAAFSARYNNGTSWYSTASYNPTLIEEIEMPLIEEICDSAFYSQKMITDIATPQLKKVGKFAFDMYYDYSSNGLLRTINLGNVENIGDAAFRCCNNLEDVDLSKVTSIGDYAFSNCDKLTNVNISNVDTIPSNAFYNCSSLETVDARRATTIGSYAFSSCSNLKNVNISKTERIEDSAFRDCKLSQISLPNVSYLGNSAFSNNSAATSINLSDKLTSIGSNAFYGCRGVEELTLPASLTLLPSNCFAGSNNIKTISCNAPAPPAVGETPFTMQTLYTATLRVPESSVGLYQAHDYWKHFFYWETNPDVLRDLIIASSLVLGDTRMDKLHLTINPGVALSMGGTTKQDFSSVVFKANSSQAGMFISDCPLITSDATSIELQMAGLQWYFITLPFDATISDIINCSEAQLAIYSYDGAHRATSTSGSNWSRVRTGDLHAHQGYIIQASKATTLTIPATYETKDKVFVPEDVVLPLQANTCATAANAGWNFVGNPYAAYYDISQMDFEAPITVWTGSTYTAYNPMDDDLALRPMQPFFVQCPDGVHSINFSRAGRQATNTIEHPASARAMAAKGSVRRIVDVVLSNEQGSDRTRVVLSSVATDDYDMSCDAAKMMSMDETAPQLYTEQGGVEYAINEGPHTTGIVELTYYAPQPGRYTLRLDRHDVDVMLYDEATGQTTELTEEGYTFQTEEGLFTDRFQLLFAPEDVTSIQQFSIQQTDAENYNLEGKRLQQPAEGVNIISQKGKSIKQIVR